MTLKLGEEISEKEFNVALACGAEVGKQVTWTTNFHYESYRRAAPSTRLSCYFYLGCLPSVMELTVPQQRNLRYFLLEEGSNCEAG